MNSTGNVFHEFAVATADDPIQLDIIMDLMTERALDAPAVI